MNQVLIILTLLAVFGSRGIAVLDSPYGARKFINFTTNDEPKASTNISDGEGAVFKKESSTQTPIGLRQEDQDPSASSESIVYNRFEKPSNNEDKSPEEEEGEPEGPPDHVIPHSEHEEPRNVPTRPKYTAPGEWAKVPKDKEVNLDFVPSRVYAQVRKTHTLRRLPRKKAIENAESEEEKENAARLREVVKNTKVNTVYTEEGYEDAAYDHAGHIRDADFHEGYARKLHDHLDEKKRSKDDDGADYEEEENETRQRAYKKVKPEEFEDFDEDYSDRHETGTEAIGDGVRGDGKSRKRVDPKLLAEQGIERLQEDLEREVEEIERGVEISKLEKVETTTEAVAESQKSDDYNKIRDLRWRKARRKDGASSLTGNNKDNSREKLEGYKHSQSPEIPAADQANRDAETTTSRARLENLSGRSAESYRYEVAENSPNFQPVDILSPRSEENPTTISYSQLFWDYFKRRQNLLSSTETPAVFESTTLEGNTFPNSSFDGNAPTILPFSAYEQESTTSFPAVESVIYNPQQSVPRGQVSYQPAFPNNNVQDNQLVPAGVTNLNEIWQPINSNVTAATGDGIQSSDIYSNSPKSLNGQEEPSNNFGSNFFNPSLSSSNRRPKYKITIRHKPKKSESAESSSQVSIAPINPTNEPLIENTTPDVIPINENYMKVLTHLQNEYNVKNRYHPNGLQQTNFLAASSKNELEDLTRLRPPRPQKPNEYYYNFAQPQPGIDVSESDWNAFPVPPRSQQSAYTNPRKPAIQHDAPRAKQNLQTKPRYPFDHKRNNLPPFEFLPPAALLRGDSIRHKETMDYVNRGANRSSKQSRNVHRPFHQTIGHSGPRAKRRERRSATGPVDDDESGGIVKGSMANNGTSNRGKLERAAKNLSIERNCPQKVTRGIEVGLAPNTSRAEQSGEKKLKFFEDEEGEVSRAVERESSIDTVKRSEGRNADGDSMAVEYDREVLGKENDNESMRSARNVRRTERKDGSDEPREFDIAKKDAPLGEETLIESTETRRDGQDLDPEIRSKLQQHEKLLNAAPKIVGDVIDKEIDAHFKEEGQEDEGSDDGEKKVEVEVPEFDYVEEMIEEDQPAQDVAATTEMSIDSEKYPFYSNENLPMPSALKYTMDPNRLPKKTYGGMEFYNSRDAYKHCDDVEPNLAVLPEKEVPEAESGPKENLPRLQGLGDKLDCFKAKYFDDNPFDNPLFLEEEVEDPVAPPQLDTKRFASRIMMFPKEDDDLVIQKSSRRPENYRQPRIPISVRLQKAQPVRYKNYPRIRTRTTARPRKRPIVYRVQVPQVKTTKASRRPQSSAKNSATSASELSALYMPYQNQVYEDVMGTIKNMASSYQVYETTTISASEETTIRNDEDEDELGSNSPTNSTARGKKEKNKVRIDIVEQPNDLDINIKGAARPKNRNRYRPVYKRTRRPQGNKPRIHMMQSPVVGLRAVQHRQRIRVYKRDLRDINESLEEKWSEASEENSGSVENTGEEPKDYASSEENHRKKDSEDIGTTRTRQNHHRTDSEGIKNSDPIGKVSTEVKIGQNSAAQRNSLIASTSPKPAKRRTRVLKIVRRIGAVNGDAASKDAEPEKVVYTIKDRIRYSRPKPELTKIGKFAKETKDEVEDGRRREPKYNYIRRRDSSNVVSSTTESPSSSTPSRVNFTEAASFTEKPLEANNTESKKENQQVQYLVDETKSENVNTSEKLDASGPSVTEQSKIEANETSGYAVHENVNEGEPTTTQKPQSATPSEFFSLKTFLEMDPPGYMELSAEDFTKSFFPHTNGTDADFKMSFPSSSVNETENEKDDASSNSFRPSYYSTDSSEMAETRTKVQTSTESSGESRVASKDNSEEDRTFFAYTSRPYSPPENYEDPKYADLGPRVNKPAFFHPPFSKYRKSRSGDSAEELAANDERKEEYVFPWHRDKDDQRKRRRNRGKLGGEYEYPWERRERLAREEKRRKEDRRKRLGKAFDDDDEDAEESFVSKQRRNFYPRGRYRYWSRNDRDVPEDNGADNAESSSESRPAMKYSSRYNSKNSRLPLKDHSSGARSENVEEISRSIKKALEGDSEEKETSMEREDSSWEKKKSFSYRPRSISKGIVPEDVTLAPTRKLGRRGKLKDDHDSSTPENMKSSRSRNSLDDSESQISTTKTDLRGNENSTKQPSKKKRKQSKNATSPVESTAKPEPTGNNRARRRQKSGPTTPATIISTTSASTVIRRRNDKLVRHSKKTESSKAQSKSNNDVSNEPGMSKSGTVEHRSRARKKNRTSELLNEATKSVEQRVPSTNSSRRVQHSEKVNDAEETEVEKEIVDEKLMNDNVNRNEERSESKQPCHSEKSEERYDYKDDKVTALNDFDGSERTYDDDDYDSGSVAETDPNFTPENGALQVSEQGSRELATSVSWTSENYDF